MNLMYDVINPFSVYNCSRVCHLLETDKPFLLTSQWNQSTDDKPCIRVLIPLMYPHATADWMDTRFAIENDLNRRKLVKTTPITNVANGNYELLNYADIQPFFLWITWVNRRGFIGSNRLRWIPGLVWCDRNQSAEKHASDHLILHRRRKEVNALFMVRSVYAMIPIATWT